jgi:hypothetical protein
LTILGAENQIPSGDFQATTDLASALKKKLRCWCKLKGQGFWQAFRGKETPFTQVFMGKRELCGSFPWL